MKKTILFKTLVDILYYLHFLGLLGMFLIIPFDVMNINQVNLKIEDWNFFHWLILLVSIIVYIIFLRGLYFLRKTAKFLLFNNHFSKDLSTSLNKSGNHFLITGLFSFLLMIAFSIFKITQGKIELIHNFNSMTPLFLMIIGLFFIIQSKTLEIAKNYKEENELTV